MTDLVVTNQNGIQLLADLEAAGAATTTGLTLPPDLPWERYLALAEMFGQLHRTSAFLLGDLMNYGENEYGQKYAQAASLTGLAESTLMNYSSVCRYVPRQLRKQELSFSHHAEVAYLEGPVQKRLLEQAVEENWNRGSLRDAASEFRVKQPKIELSTPGIPDARVDRVSQDQESEPGSEIICHCRTCGRAHYTDRDVVKIS